MHDLRLCPCGKVHVVYNTALGLVIACPTVPPNQWILYSDRYLGPAEVHIPRPETVW